MAPFAGTRRAPDVLYRRRGYAWTRRVDARNARRLRRAVGLRAEPRDVRPVSLAARVSAAPAARHVAPGGRGRAAAPRVAPCARRGRRVGVSPGVQGLGSPHASGPVHSLRRQARAGPRRSLTAPRDRSAAAARTPGPCRPRRCAPSPDRPRRSYGRSTRRRGRVAGGVAPRRRCSRRGDSGHRRARLAALLPRACRGAVLPRVSARIRARGCRPRSPRRSRLELPTRRPHRARDHNDDALRHRANRQRVRHASRGLPGRR